MPDTSAGHKPADRLLAHCTYRIATGKWRPGERLPSIREMRRRWGVNQQSVQDAYRRLVDKGLAESRPRSGYYVAGGGDLDRLARHRHELENLHLRVRDLLGRETRLSTLGVLRYIAQLEEMQRADEPEVAFVECTATQAAAHAAEIAARLQVPVMALTTGQLAGRAGRVPHHVRRLLTSPFHLEEVRQLQDPPRRSVAAVPIEVSPAIAGAAAQATEIVILERDESMAAHIAEDASRLLAGREVRSLLTERPALQLEKLLGRRVGRSRRLLVLLSPRLWGEIDPAWHAHPDVRQVSFRICPAAWPHAAEAAGLPLTP